MISKSSLKNVNKLYNELNKVLTLFNTYTYSNIEITCELIPSNVYRFTFGGDIRYVSAKNINRYLQLQIEKINNYILMIRNPNEDEIVNLILINNALVLESYSYHIM